MHVVIIGAGEVGWYLADRLQAENHDVVVVENDPGRAQAISEQLDIQVVNGSGSVPSVLTDAVEGGVAFVPGSAFAVDRDLSDHLRLSFATVAADQLDEAVQRLARVVSPG